MMHFRQSIPAVFLCTLLAYGLLPTTAHAQDWAKTKLAQSSRHGEYVTIAEPGGRKLQAWVVYPEVIGKAPVVVMIHEIFGLTDWARLMADEVAAKGYIVVEPDLLSGFGPPPASAATVPAGPTAMPMDHGHSPQAGAGSPSIAADPGGTAAFPDQGSVVKAVSGLNPESVLRDLDAAADYGKKLPASSAKVAVAGFCWGGSKSFAFATHRADLSAAFVFYGTPPPAADMAAIHAPVYGFYAEKDGRVTTTVPQTITDMKAAGKAYEPVIYADTGHGFMRVGQSPEAKPGDSKAFDDAFARLIKELGKMK